MYNRQCPLNELEIDMNQFKRYAIRKTPRDPDQTPWYVAIGVGETEDVAHAHLYTDVELARKKLEEFWKHDKRGNIDGNGFYRMMEIIEVTVSASETSVIVSKEK